MSENDLSDDQNEISANQEDSNENDNVDEYISQAVDAFESIKPCLNQEKCSAYL